MTNEEREQGWKSPKYGHLGVCFLCTGPDPLGPRPGERVKIAIYDGERVVRRLEQAQGRQLQEGYVDFFFSERCRPSVHEYHIIDVDAEGEATVLATHTEAAGANRWFHHHFPDWCVEHGVERGESAVGAQTP